MKTKIFCDSADYKTIKFYDKKSTVSGFTTNPSLMRIAGANDYKKYSLEILKICKKNQYHLKYWPTIKKRCLSRRTK